jgi:hypothetical protein
LAGLGTVATDHTKALFAQGNTVAAALTGGYQLAWVLAAVVVVLGVAVVLSVVRAPRPAPAPTVEEAEAEAA